MLLKKMIAFWSICLLITVQTGGAFAAAMQGNDIGVRRLIDETKRKAGIKEMSVAVYCGGTEEIYDREDADMLYQIGSMTKAFTALAVLYLEDCGRLRLDDTVDTYLPGFHVVYQGQRTPVTLLDLLCHRSGFTNSQKQYPTAADDMSLMDYARSIVGSRVEHRPGEVFSYSNVNYNLLGAVIEAVSGETYESFMQNQILNPLGLVNTSCGNSYQDERVCEGTRFAYGFAYPYKIPVSPGRIPAGYFYSNASDMLRWMKIQTEVIDIPENYQRVIEKSHQLPQGLSPESYFAGWKWIEDGVYAHSGGTENYSSRIIIDTKQKIGVCVLANLNAAASVDALCDDLYRIKLGVAPTGFVYDIWRIFDILFSSLTVMGIGMLVLLIRQRETIGRVAFLLGCLTALITAAFLIVIPFAFREKLDIILFEWAPVSMTGGMIALLSASLLFMTKSCVNLVKRKAELRNRNPIAGAVLQPAGSGSDQAGQETRRPNADHYEEGGE